MRLICGAGWDTGYQDDKEIAMVLRYVIERHTEDERFGWRVRDLETEKRFGFGLTLDHAEWLMAQFNNWRKHADD